MPAPSVPLEKYCKVAPQSFGIYRALSIALLTSLEISTYSCDLPPGIEQNIFKPLSWIALILTLWCGQHILLLEFSYAR